MYVSDDVDCKLYLITTINSLCLRPLKLKLPLPFAPSVCHPHLGRPWRKVRDPPAYNSPCSIYGPGQSLFWGLLPVSLFSESTRCFGHIVLSGLETDREL